VLSNFPGDVDDIIYILLSEIPTDLQQELLDVYRSLGGDKTEGLDEVLKRIRWLNAQCSNFGVWGSRTPEGELYSGRNLDWSKDTGVNQFKLITVYHPPNAHAHATVGFAGITGALTGMSSQGITVHEANLESDRDTFYGFPWTLRLRAVMERASTLAEAKDLWESTNNTCGFNHAVGSVQDKDSPFMLIETDGGHSAYFETAMDPREVNAEGGDPRPDALFRTNHGFDPETIAHYQWNGTSADADSQSRYALFPALFDAVEPGTYGALEAVATVAVLGQKGADYYQCGGVGTYDDASNVISAAFAPSPGAGTLYASWEVGTGDEWTPACCTTFVQVDMESWW